jgi:uncharacterized protein YheU (UPF0270 family)
METLKQIIDGLVAEKSLSFEVREQLKKVKDESELAAQQIKTLTEQGKVKDSQFAELAVKYEKGLERNTELFNLVESYKLREKDFEKSEHTLALKNKDVEVSERALQEVKAVVSMVFKNPVVRRSIQSNGNKPTPDGYNTVYTHEEKTEVVDEE